MKKMQLEEETKGQRGIPFIRKMDIIVACVFISYIMNWFAVEKCVVLLILEREIYDEMDINFKVYDFV